MHISTRNIAVRTRRATPSPSPTPTPSGLLPAGSRVLVIGPSIAQQKHATMDSTNSAFGTANRMAQESDVQFAHAYDPHYDITDWADATDTRPNSSAARGVSGSNQGIHGERSDEIYARWSDINTTFDFDVLLIIDIGINDETGGGSDLTFQQSKDNTEDLVEAAELAGKKVIVSTLRKHLGGSNTISLTDYRDWILATFGPGTAHPDTIVYDPWNQITTITSDHQKDSGVHPGQYGALACALGEDQSIPDDCLVGAIRQVIDAGDVWEDIWDNATHITNDLGTGFTGTGGSGGAGITDTAVADGWFVNRNTTASTTWVLTKDGTADDFQLCETTPSGTEYRNCRWTYNLTAGEVANLADEHIRVLMECEMPDQAALSVPYIYLNFNDTDYLLEWGRVGDNTTNIQDCRRTLGAGLVLPMKIMTGTIKMPASGITSCALRFELQSSAKHDTSAGTIKLKRVGIFAVSNPQTAWLV